MTSIMESFVKKKVYLEGWSQGTMKVVEEEEHKMSKIQAFIPIVSNENKVKDVSLPETFVITLEEDTHGCSHTNTYHKCNQCSVLC
jgi:hypothetical protein